jgi:hypothetical protein
MTETTTARPPRMPLLPVEESHTPAEVIDPHSATEAYRADAMTDQFTRTTPRLEQRDEHSRN